MKNIKQNRHSPLKLQIEKRNYWDLMLLDDLNICDSSKLDNCVYNNEFITGNTLVEPVGYCDYIKYSFFDGGYYQLSGDVLDVLDNGWSFEMEFIKKETNCEDNEHLYENFSGLQPLVYWGVAGEYKFANFENITGDSIFVNDNSFLDWSDDKVCEKEDLFGKTKKYSYSCNYLNNNAFMVYLNEGYLGFRWIGSDDCGKIIINDVQTDVEHVDLDVLYKLIIRYKNNSLEFFLDGLLILKILDVTLELECEDYSKFVFYVGGAVLPTEIEVQENFSTCDFFTCFELDEVNYLSVNGLDLEITGVTWESYYLLETYISILLENFVGTIKATQKSNCNGEVIQLYISNTNKQFNTINNTPFKKSNCINYIIEGDKCEVFENYFIGNFVGTINYFKMYDIPLTITQIRE